MRRSSDDPFETSVRTDLQRVGADVPADPVWRRYCVISPYHPFLRISRAEWVPSPTDCIFQPEPVQPMADPPLFDDQWPLFRILLEPGDTGVMLHILRRLRSWDSKWVDYSRLPVPYDIYRNALDMVGGLAEDGKLWPKVR